MKGLQLFKTTANGLSRGVKPTTYFRGVDRHAVVRVGVPGTSKERDLFDRTVRAGTYVRGRNRVATVDPPRESVLAGWDPLLQRRKTVKRYNPGPTAVADLNRLAERQRLCGK